MNTNVESTFSYFLAGIAVGAIAGLLLAPRSGENTRKSLRERRNKGLDILNKPPKKLRESAEAVVKKGRKSTGRQRDLVEAATRS